MKIFWNSPFYLGVRGEWCHNVDGALLVQRTEADLFEDLKVLPLRLVVDLMRENIVEFTVSSEGWN